MNFIESFNSKTILIPLLQRDYVQGGREDVIVPFLDSLLKTNQDLNYIYGYEEDGCFVPVDGQQRLTTLWLLYLYLYSRKQCKNKFNINIRFASREYAEDFCERLSLHLEKLVKENDADSLDKVIVNQNWFIQSWLSNTSLRNMLATLKFIHRKINEENFDSIWNRLVVSATPGITFAFLQMDERNGLDDDIYIKMNGRGRKLSAFENLKSFMDENVAGLFFAEDWKMKMDNKWADMFWDNRNRQQEHPEEIDDEQLYCLYNLLILYHIQNDELLDTIIRIKDEETLLYEELTSFFGKNEKTEVKDVIKSVIERLQKAGNFPLTWFERLNLLSPGFFKFAYNKLNTLTSYCKKFNEMQLYIGESDSEKTSRTYQLCMCEGSFGRTLPLLYALLAYQEGETELFDWMRTMRNLILNTVIGSEDLPSIIKDIDAFSTLCKNSNIYTVLQSDDVKNVLDKFNKSQVKEETRKASMPEFKDEMINMENGRFFRGRIGILFRMLKEQEGYDCMSKENVKSYSSVLLELFDGNDNGLSTKFEKDYLLRRALMSFPPYYFGKEVSSCWSFNNGLTEWREYITQEDYDISSLQQLMKKLLIPEFKSGKDLVNVLSEYITDISSNFEEDIRKKDKDSHRYYFIKYPAIWAFMDTKRCVWNDNNYDIVLKSANGNNSNRMELRTISLFLDYKEKKDSINQQGWSVSIWPKEKSCMYFDFKIPGEENRTIAIDVYFYDDNGNRNSEDCYAFDLFIRPTHYDAINDEERKLFADKCFTQNESLFSSIIPEYSELFKKNDNGRLKSQVLYSKYNLKNILTKILSDISSYYKK